MPTIASSARAALELAAVERLLRQQRSDPGDGFDREGGQRGRAPGGPSRWSQERLPEYGVPRRIKLLDSIPAKETLKSDV